MPRVAVLGVRGVVGSMVAHRLRDQGSEVVGVARHVGSGSPDVDGLDATSFDELRWADAQDPDQLSAALAGCEVVVNALAPMHQVGLAVAEVACDVGAHLVDVGAEQSEIVAIHDRLAARARACGVSVVPGAGLQHLVGDTLAVLAGSAVTHAEELHVAYTLPDQASVLRASTAGRRRSLAAELGRPALAVVHGQRVEERVGEARRLAWFPRPVGPAHAAAIAGGEAITVPRALPDVQLVRTYLAVPGWRAELLQATANAARRPRMRAWIVRRIERPRPPLSDARRAALRWACVAEARGEDGEVARAWAYGHDPYRTTATVAASVAGRLAHGGVPPGVLAPSEVDQPAELLHTIAAASGLRWSTTRPDPGEDGRARAGS